VKPGLLEMLCCPRCRAGLSLSDPQSDEFGVHSGSLVCAKCPASYPIVRHVPRFVSQESYADNFGFQWNAYSVTQNDTHSGIEASRVRFFEVTRWPEHLAGETVLEAGCGAGRFTQIALATGATVCSLDLSSAVEANWKNHRQHPNFHIVQADIDAIPFRDRSFDRAFCLGVLQHCPDPEAAFHSIVRRVRTGGSIAVDIYRLKPRDLINPINWLRLITVRMPVHTLYRIVKIMTPPLFAVKKVLIDSLPFGRHIGFFIPVIYHAGVVPGAERMPRTQQLEWAILDTYDALSARYDKPRTVAQVRRWFEKDKLAEVCVERGFNGVNGRGTVAL
jgi:SAM-dependent methyltransferase